MKRIIFMVIRHIIKVPIWFYKICKYGKSEEYSEEKRYALVREIVHSANKKGRVNIICSGTENLPKESGYIMFPNHQGLYDMLLVFDTHERPCTFVIKSELKDTILLKQVIRLLKAQAIDRDDVRQSVKVIQKMSEEVKEGRNYIIFAEGTRSKDGNNVHEFKGGSFKSATKAKCPIVPVVIIDSYKPFDESSIKPVTVQIHYMEPLYYEEYKDMGTRKIAEEVKNRIQKKINDEIGK